MFKNLWRIFRPVQRSISIKEIDLSTFCILPWIHLSTRPNGHMRVCCTANASSAGATNEKSRAGEVGILKNNDGRPANFNHTDLWSAWNNSYMRKIRRYMLSGRIPSSCTKCFKEESSGYRSKRIWETEYWKKRIDYNEIIKSTKKDGSVPPQIYYIDLRMGSKCNLKCIMCSPHDSSMWVEDWKKLNEKIKNRSLKETMMWDNEGIVDGASYDWYLNNNIFWTQLYKQIPYLKQLYFAGGEPTIIEQHYMLLEKCIEMGYAKNILLRYNSNGVIIPDRLIKLWDSFQFVRFHYSVDSVFNMNDYIRYPSKWNHTVDMFHRLDNTKEHIEVTVACAVQMLNMYYIPEFIKWKLDQKFKKINIWPLGAGLINYHFVYHPAHLNVKVFPLWFKRKIAEKYKVFYSWLEDNVASSGGVLYTKDEFMSASYGINRLKGMVNFMNSEDWSIRMPEFREYIKSIDEIRATSFNDTFPEMVELMREEND